VVDNSIDEALAGYCKNIVVTIFEDNPFRWRMMAVESDGDHTKEQEERLEMVMTDSACGGKFDKNTYKVSAGFTGGCSCVNALSSDLHVTVFREGKISSRSIRSGAAVPVGRSGSARKRERRCGSGDASIFITLTTTRISSKQAPGAFVPQPGECAFILRICGRRKRMQPLQQDLLQ